MDDQDRRGSSRRAANGRGPSIPRRSSVTTPGHEDPAPSRPTRGGQWSLDPDAADRYLQSRETEIQGDPAFDPIDHRSPEPSSGDDASRESRPRRGRRPDMTTRQGRSITSDDLPSDVERVNLATTGRVNRRSSQTRASGESVGRRGRETARRTSSSRPMSLRLPASLQSSSLLGDRIAVALGAAAVFSVVLMWVTISSRIGSLPDTISVRRGSEGVATRFDAPSALWQIPLVATVATLMNGIVAWATHRGDRFASRVTLGLTFMIHVLIWVAIVQFVW